MKYFKSTHLNEILNKVFHTRYPISKNAIIRKKKEGRGLISAKFITIVC